MPRKSKVTVTDDQIIELIKQSPAMSNRAMAKKLGMSVSGPSNTRIKSLKETISAGPRADIQLYDTLTKDGNWYRIIKLDEDSFTVKRTDGYGDTIVVRKSDYLAGKTGYKKRDLPPVKTYIDPALAKKKPGMTINQDFEDAVCEMEAEHALRRLEMKEQASSVTAEARPTTEEVLAETAEKIKQKPKFEPVDYTDPEWGVIKPISNADEPMDEITIPIKLVAGNRPYLDRISQLLDLMMPECGNERIRTQVSELASNILFNGIRKEAGHE